MDIQIRNLSKSYGTQKAVDNISFEVKTGEVLGFLGPNGAGKTTTMKMITNYLQIESGDILVGGKSVTDEGLKKHIGYLPEHNPLYLDMPVLDYLAFCAALQKVPKAQIDGQIREMVRKCGLNQEKHKVIGELSKGYRQRVGLAQAMIHDPEILILDEPTTGLDPNQRVEIRELIRDLGKEKTVILSTHILPEVEATCDRILIINQGSIVANGTSASLRKQASGDNMLKVRISGGETSSIQKALLDIEGASLVDIVGKNENRFEIQSSGPELNEAVFRLCVNKNWVLQEMVPIETKLEDIFRDLTLN